MGKKEIELLKAIGNVLVLARQGSGVNRKKNQAVDRKKYELACEFRQQEKDIDKEVGKQINSISKLIKKIK